MDELEEWQPKDIEPIFFHCLGCNKLIVGVIEATPIEVVCGSCFNRHYMLVKECDDEEEPDEDEFYHS